MLVDTSAWIEWLRGTGSPSDLMLTSAFERGDDLFVTGVVIQEILQGSRGDEHFKELQHLLTTCRWFEPVYPETYQHAANLYRRCKIAGRSVRGTVDCLIAAIAIERDIAILAHDRDFKTLSDICGLRLTSPIHDRRTPGQGATALDTVKDRPQPARLPARALDLLES